MSLFGRKRAPEPEPLRIVRMGRDRLDPNSSTWHAVATWAQDEIERLRKRNDSLNNAPDETAALRGEIRALKRLLTLTQPEQVVPPSQADPDE